MNDNCEVCFKIVCGRCKWEPDEIQVSLIQAEKLTACPDCGWKPGDAA